jgi:phosphoglycolate phosphatase
MTIKAILFDFDGTIADTRDVFIKIVNRLAPEFGYQPVSQEKIEQLQKLSSREIIKQSEISLVQIPFLLKRVKAELSHEIEGLKTFDGLADCLYSLKEQGYKLGIATSNSQKNVRAFLEENDLAPVFEFIYSGIPLFGKHQIINKFLKHQGLQPQEIVYVGDETRDINSAKKSGVKAIAVGWGFNAPEILAKHNPDYLALTPSQLQETLLGWENSQPEFSAAL